MADTSKGATFTPGQWMILQTTVQAMTQSGRGDAAVTFIGEMLAWATQQPVAPIPVNETVDQYLSRTMREWRLAFARMDDAADRVAFAQLCADALGADRGTMFMILSRRAKYLGEQ